MAKPRFKAHAGDVIPVPDNLMIEVIFSDGETAFGLSDRWRWEQCDNCTDIIAYRVIEQE